MSNQQSWNQLVAAANPRPAPRTRGTPVAMQGRTKGGATELSAQYRCSKCAIAYDVPHGDKAHCPMCAVETELRKTQLHLQEAKETIAGLNRQLAAMASQVDHVNAIRQALDIISPEDKAWLKGVMYRYRADKSLSLMSLYIHHMKGRPTNRGAHNSFVLVERGRENESYTPTSPGGIAIVGYYQEITRELGAKQAMAYLLRALSQVLTGGSPE